MYRLLIIHMIHSHIMSIWTELEKRGLDDKESSIEQEETEKQSQGAYRLLLARYNKQ